MQARWVGLWRRSWSTRFDIRTQLLALLLALAVPFVIYLSVTAVRQAGVEREQAGQQMLGIARLTAARLDDHVGDIRQLLLVLSRVVGPTAADTARDEALLRELRPNLPAHINNVSVWDASGELMAALDPRLRLQMTNASRRKFFIEATERGEFALEGPVVSATNGELVGVFALPMLRGDKVIGVVAVSAQLQPLQALLAPEGSLPSRAVITVSDVSGVVLARSADPAKWIGRNLLTGNGGSLRDSLQRREGVRQAPSADGIDRIAGFTMTQRVPWLVYVGVPTSIALAPATERLRENVAVGSVVFLIGLALAVRVGKKISVPLRRLGEDAAMLERGELSHRSRVGPGGEIGLLAATLNRMADALQERTDSLEASEEQLRQITDNLPVMIAYIDREQRFRFANRMYREWLDFDPAWLLGRTLLEVYGEATYSTFRRHMEAGLAGRRVVYERDLIARGTTRRVESTLVPHIKASGSVQGVFALVQDVTARREAEAQLRQRADFDALTGLPNRALFFDRLHQAMVRAARYGRPMALLFLDIDHFKAVNDTLGHEGGDGVLKAFAKTLQESLRSADTAARLAGDEFTVILEELHGLDDAKAVAESLVGKARQPLQFNGRSIRVSTSIGIAMFSRGEADGAALLRRADKALYAAKRRGRDGYACEDDVEGDAGSVLGMDTTPGVGA